MEKSDRMDNVRYNVLIEERKTEWMIEWTDDEKKKLWKIKKEKERNEQRMMHDIKGRQNGKNKNRNREMDG